MTGLIIVSASPNTVSKVIGILAVVPKDIKYNLCILGTKENLSVQMPSGFDNLFCIPAPNNDILLEHSYTSAIAQHIKDEEYSYIFSPCDMLCTAIMQILAAQIRAECFTDIVYIDKEIVKRKVYAANIYADIFYKKNIVFCTVKEITEKNTSKTQTYVTKSIGAALSCVPWIIDGHSKIENKENLIASAKVLFVAGKGVGSKDNLEKLKTLAIKLGAEFGVTRAVALSGWERLDKMIGQSGIIASPNLCVTFGVSGAAPFLSGIENSKKIIAINKDKTAGIFRIANMGITMDCNELIKEMEKMYG